MLKRAAEVNAFDAKTHFSRILREVERGTTYLIRRRGKAVAKLVPAGLKGPRFDPVEWIRAFQEIRSRVRGRVNVRRLICEGRRM